MQLMFLLPFCFLCFLPISSVPVSVLGQPLSGSPQCSPGQSDGDLGSLTLSVDQTEHILLQLTPNFSPSLFSYTATVDNSLTQVYVTFTGAMELQHLDFRVGQGNWQLDVPPGVPIAVALDGVNPVNVYIYADCSCHNEYYLTISPSNTGVKGDPQFTGLKGQSYQVHGIPNEYYNLITDSYVQYNSKFVYLSEGECPVVDGKVVPGDCWTHPGTYLGEVGFKTNAGDRLHVVAGEENKGFQSVALNGLTLKVGDQVPLNFLSNPALPSASLPSVHYVSSHLLEVEGAGFYSLSIMNSDWFVNQNIRVLNWNSINSHGLLGQTWQKPKTKGQIKEIQGYVDDYLILDHQLWGDNFLFNQFHMNNTDTNANSQSQSSTETKKGQPTKVILNKKNTQNIRKLKL